LASAEELELDVREVVRNLTHPLQGKHHLFIVNALFLSAKVEEYEKRPNKEEWQC
jgi:hypothetical protein